ATEVHPRNEKTVLQAQALAVPTRAPSMHRSKGKLPASRIKKVGCLATQFNRAISELIVTLEETLPWFVVCVKSNDQAKPGWADARKVLNVVKGFALNDIAKRKRIEYAATMLQSDFCERYSMVIAEYAPEYGRNGDPQSKCRALKQAMGLDDSAMNMGSSKVFMDYETWRRIDDPIRARERGAQNLDDDHLTQTGDEKMGIDGVKYTMANESSAGVSFHVGNEGEQYTRALKQRLADNDTRSFYSDDEAYQDMLNKDGFSDMISEVGGYNSGFSDVLSNAGGDYKDSLDEEDEGTTKTITTVRRIWLFVVKVSTWMIPNKAISCCAKRRRKDEQIAWREKLTLCMLITWCCAVVIFWICGLGMLLCPRQNVYSIQELGGHSSDTDALIAIRGEVFDVKDFTHMNINFDYLLDHNYLGRDLSDIFPLQLSFVCPFSNMDPRLSMQDKPVLYSEAYYHDNRWWRHPTDKGYNYYQYRLMRIMRQNYAKGHIAVDPALLRQQAAGTAKGSIGKNFARCIINGEVFDLTDYIASNGAPYVVVPDGQSNSTSFNRQFLDSNVVTMFDEKKGQDITEMWNAYFGTNANMRNLHYQCLRGAFYVGKVDGR
ncbi:hypothetical protein LPJ66_011428, partial [Kickxella alabastrina]